MPKLESHTLHQVETELPAELLARAVSIAGGIGSDAQQKASEQSGAFSFDEPQVFSVLGDRLEEVSKQMDRKERLAKIDTPLGTLAAGSAISMATGCWSVVDAWRNDHGYGFVFNPEDYGHEIDRSSSFKGVLAHRMAFNMRRRVLGLPDLKRKEQLDHICRWPGCCNVDHLKVVDHKTNNRLRDKARTLEAAIAAGQIILGPTGDEFLDGLISGSRHSDTMVIISTPAGPFRIIKLDDDPLMYRGEPEPSLLHDVVKPPAVSKYERPSRAKKPFIHDEQADLFAAGDYDGRRVRKADLYKQAMKRR